MCDRILDIAGNDVTDLVDVDSEVENIRLCLVEGTDEKPICYICGKFRKPKVINKTDDGLEEIDLDVVHKKCIKIYNKYLKLKQDLLDTEFKLFQLKN